MKKLMFIFGTRPEFIKIYPVFMEAKRQGENVILVNTGQHKEMVNQLLNDFNVEVDYDLKIMDHSNGLSEILSNSIMGLEGVLQVEKDVDIILVHGDTSATLAGSLVAFYHKIKLAHIEAGLRTFNKFEPFPEEINRVITGRLADIHFTPTTVTYDNLISENVDEKSIHIVGNTAIDMLNYTVKSDYTHEVLQWQKEKKIVLITAHRRENIEELDNVFAAINKLATTFYDDYKFIYPIHFNPIIRKKAEKYFNVDNIKVIEPLDTIDFHNIMSKSYLILTDSGGIQEEAPSLGKPVLVLRNVTERPEGVAAGTLKLVGTNPDVIFETAYELLTNQDKYFEMSAINNPYGMGDSAVRIVNVIKKI